MGFYDTVLLEKGMYNSNGSLTDKLEEIDSSNNYNGSNLEGLDAFERQLRRFDIKINGINSDQISRFFQNSQTATLFPEYVKRSVLQGIKEGSILEDIIATNTKINALDYRPITSVSKDDNTIKKTAEMGNIPITEIRTQPNLANLFKRGRMLVSSYEAIKYERLDLFAVTLKQIGNYIAKSQLEDAIDTLINGDGNNNESEIITVNTANTLTYQDLINLWSHFKDFQMDRLLVAPDVMMQILSIDEFRNPATGLNFQGTGKLSTPLGATLYNVDKVPQGHIIALDRSCALEMITKDSVTVETDKLIDRQLERAAITATAGFAKIFPQATKVMSL